MATVSSLASMAPEPSVSKRSKASLFFVVVVVVVSEKKNVEFFLFEKRNQKVLLFDGVDVEEEHIRPSFSCSLFLPFSSSLSSHPGSPDLLLLLLGETARAGGSAPRCSSCSGGALGRLAAGRGDGAAVGGLLNGFSKHQRRYVNVFYVQKAD